MVEVVFYIHGLDYGSDELKFKKILEEMNNTIPQLKEKLNQTKKDIVNLQSETQTDAKKKMIRQLIENEGALMSKIQKIEILCNVGLSLLQEYGKNKEE